MTRTIPNSHDSVFCSDYQEFPEKVLNIRGRGHAQTFTVENRDNPTADRKAKRLKLRSSLYMLNEGGPRETNDGKCGGKAGFAVCISHVYWLKSALDIEYFTHPRRITALHRCWELTCWTIAHRRLRSVPTKAAVGSVTWRHSARGSRLACPGRSSRGEAPIVARADEDSASTLTFDFPVGTCVHGSRPGLRQRTGTNENSI